MLKQACTCCKVVGVVAILGLLNWGCIAAFNYNVVDHIFGVGSVVSRVIYGLFGLSGLALLVSFFRVCPKCIK